jgi:hypothetical protein
LVAESAHLTSAKPRDSVRALFERCEAIVTRGVELGAVKDDTLVDYAAMLHGCLRAVFTRGRIYGDPVDPTLANAAALAEFFMRGAARSP